MNVQNLMQAFSSMQEGDAQVKALLQSLSGQASGYAGASKDYSQEQQEQLSRLKRDEVQQGFDLSMEGTREAHKLQTVRNQLDSGIRQNEALLQNEFIREKSGRDAASEGMNIAMSANPDYRTRFTDMRGIRA